YAGGLVLPANPPDEFPDLAFRDGAHKAVHRLAVAEGNHGRDRLDAELAGNRRMVVNVHLDQLDLAGGVAHRLLKYRGELLAGATPGCPEIDQNGLVAGFLDHVGGKAGRGGILYEVAGRRGRRSRVCGRGPIADGRGVGTTRPESGFVAHDCLSNRLAAGAGPPSRLAPNLAITTRLSR